MRSTPGLRPSSRPDAAPWSRRPATDPSRRSRAAASDGRCWSVRTAVRPTDCSRPGPWFSASVSARWPSDAGVFGLPVSRSRCDAGGERRLRTTWPRRTHAREASRRHRRRGRGAGRHTSTDQAAFGRASPLVPDGRARAGGAGFARRPRRDPAPGRLGRRPNDAAQHASSALAALRVQAVDATPVLRALSDAGRRVRGLTVAEARLEDVFLHLTDPQGRT